MTNIKPQITCRCPAYPFPHRQGGGDCELPKSCSVMDDYRCLDGEDNECPFCDDCPLMDEMRHASDMAILAARHPSLTAQERNGNFRGW